MILGKCEVRYGGHGVVRYELKGMGLGGCGIVIYGGLGEG